MTVLYTTAFTSCNKDGDDDDYSSPTPFSGGLSGVLEDEYASWDFVGISCGGGDIIETTPIIDGKFTFSSLPTPKPEELEPVIESEEIPIDFKISDRDAKVCGMSLLAIKGEAGVSFTGKGIMQVVAASNSVTMIMYYYADKDVKIKGSYSGTERGVNYNLEVNMNLKQGWNTVHQIMVSSEKNGLTTISKNGIPPSGTFWTGISL